MNLRIVSAGLLVTALASARSDAQVTQPAQISPGVTHSRIVDPTGPWVINVVKVDLRGGRYELRHVRARDSIAGREKTSAMASRQPEGADAVVAAINADFFNTRTGEVENSQVIGGEWWKGVRGPDSQFDAFGIARSQFAVSAAGKPLLDRFRFEGTVVYGRTVFPLHTVNFRPRAGTEVVTLYTERYGVTPRDTVRTATEAPLRRVGARGDTTLFVRISPVSKGGGLPIPKGTAVLSALGPRLNTVATFAEGDTVKVILHAVGQITPTPFAPRVLIGGWPRIVAGGRNVAARAPWDETTISSNAEARHPRSVVGFSRDSTQLILMTVDGRQAASVGVTLVELADLVLKQGGWDALNFDGGGSTALVIKGSVANSPSDPTGEREVGNALLVVRKTP